MNIIAYGNPHPEFQDHLNSLLNQAGRASEVCVEEMDPEFTALLCAWDGASDLMDHLFPLLHDTSNTRLLLSVPDQQKYKAYCKKLTGIAEWGCCLSETIAIEFAPASRRLLVQLHETLHLFGIDDCYQPASQFPKESCDLPTCLMRYETPSSHVCKNVLRQLRHGS
ncbi:hypothetical protein [Thiocapsa sp. UBA6158]|uniref:hypothetical protein n=1 Tax=Thiocapsa sp. UBA6158 TaxID=1947692 RepID=UPI0025FF4E4D|nr:hypothetical protein [Thiocapsa sp. UBA6158]